MKTKRNKKKLKIEDDPRWEEHVLLKKKGDIIKANKLKKEIINSYFWKKPCHHVAGEVN
jgi:hypothetical protein